MERFKYDIISSNLLSTTLSTHTPYPKSPTFPGTIATSPVRRRRSGGTLGRPKQDEENAGYWVWAVGIVLLCAGYFILGLAACGFAWITSVEAGATEDMQDVSGCHSYTSRLTLFNSRLTRSKSLCAPVILGILSFTKHSVFWKRTYPTHHQQIPLLPASLAPGLLQRTIHPCV